MIQKIINTDKIKSSLVSTAGYLWRTRKSPDEVLGELFADVQKQQIYSDGKTFVDLIPKRRMKQVQQEYLLAKQDPQFDLREFVTRHFSELPSSHSQLAFVSDPNMTVSDHIASLWHHLERRNRRDRGSLIALPYTYVVPLSLIHI